MPQTDPPQPTRPDTNTPLLPLQCHSRKPKNYLRISGFITIIAASGTQSAILIGNFFLRDEQTCSKFPGISFFCP